METRKKIVWILGVLFIAALACTLPSQQPRPEATYTAQAFTQAALQTQRAENGGLSLAIQTPTNTPTQATPTPTLTPTPIVPMVSVSVDTNCRTGPGMAYDYMTALTVGQQAEAVGKYTAASPIYYVIKHNDVTCWLWGQYATLFQGDLAQLPEMIPPPSPTPSPTASPTPTPTPTLTPTSPPQGDLYIADIYMSTQYAVVIRVGVSPTGSLNGTFQYTLYANNAQVDQGICSVPVGMSACHTAYTVTGATVIQAVIDSNNLILETNEGNNTSSRACNTNPFGCN